MTDKKAGRTVTDEVVATVAVGLITAGVVKVDLHDPPSLLRLREATEKVCAALFPEEDTGLTFGFTNAPGS